MLTKSDAATRTHVAEDERAPKVQHVDEGPPTTTASSSLVPVHMPAKITSFSDTLNAQFAAIQAMTAAVQSMAENMSRMNNQAAAPPQATAAAPQQSTTPCASARTRNPTTSSTSATTQSGTCQGTSITDEDLAKVISKPDDVVAPKLNPALSKHITKIARSFNDTVDKFFKCQTRIEKLSNDMDYMTKEPDKNAFLTGTRPFRTPATDVELDAPVINAMERPITFSVTVKQGATRREAMVHLHHKMTLEIKRIQYDAALAHLEELKPMSSWKTE